jgi:general nucleoside transport system permease protein
MAEFDAVALTAWIAASLRSATPLLLVMLGETLTQRTGVINLGVEGEMLMGACIGFAAAASTGDPLAGLAAGAVAGLALSTIHAALVLGAQANQIGSGLAVWIIGLGLTSYYGRAFVGGKVDALRPLSADFPDTPAFVRTILDQITPTAPLALALAGLAGLWLYRTRTGLIWRTVGESAEVARALGIRPARVRPQSILLGGALAGLGGAVLSVDYTQTWARDITKGKGLVAVGLVIVARWNPYLVIPDRAAVRRQRDRGAAPASGRRRDLSVPAGDDALSPRPHGDRPRAVASVARRIDAGRPDGDIPQQRDFRLTAASSRTSTDRHGHRKHPKALVASNQDR